MRIAVLSFEYPPDTGFGGIGTYSFYQARALAKLGHEVFAIAGAAEPGHSDKVVDGVRVLRTKKESWLTRMLELGRKNRCWWGVNRIEGAYAAYTTLRKLIDQHQIDFIEFPECGADGLITTTMLDIPSAVKFHSPAQLIMPIYDTPKMDRELTSFFEQVAINQATVRTSCSRFLADEVEQKMHVKPPVHVIPNGIDVELFDRDDGVDVQERFGLPKDGVKVFFANRLEERKGIHLVRDMCFEVMRKYPHVHFVFAGNDLFGYMKREIQPFIDKNKLQKRFHYLGQLDLPSVRAILKQIDIFLIPSLWENCPYSCIEAMTAGRAIVSSDCGGMPELIQHEENGLLAENDSSSSFVAALERMVEDAALRERLGQAARRTVESRLTDVGIAERAVALYSEHTRGEHAG